MIIMFAFKILFINYFIIFRETHTRFSLIENYKENSSIETNEIHLYILESNSTLFYDLQHSWFYQLIVSIPK